ncbi:hypothetical protein CSA56_17675 [candidate division KSB3 bacterium]|uniref:Uncharacterized protein n=1 Tax=candidate division KSB3 bacterium TaxID=2044937 RepID=A0A2G6K9H9_9BACT|nr:MAG: hypothetical protein CSA56_17675 [candidate division KSB3 bacterium]
MKRYSRHIQQELRKLALLAVEKELRLQLTELSTQFHAWKSGEISSRELRHVIHLYVDGPSRELFRQHREVPADIFVADAFARGVLQKEDVPDDVLTAIQNGIQFYHNVLENA